MTDPPKPDGPLPTRVYRPKEVGWVRVPEADTPTALAWERPDGKIILTQREYGETGVCIAKLDMPKGWWRIG